MLPASRNSSWGILVAWASPVAAETKLFFFQSKLLWENYLSQQTIVTNKNEAEKKHIHLITHTPFCFFCFIYCHKVSISLQPYYIPRHGIKSNALGTWLPRSSPKLGKATFPSSRSGSSVIGGMAASGCAPPCAPTPRGGLAKAPPQCHTPYWGNDGG